MSERQRLNGAEAIVAVEEGALLVDVRSPAGRARHGEIKGAIIIAKTDVVPLLRAKIGRSSSDQKIVLFCGSAAGTEPLLAALVEAGVPEVYEVDGGFAALTGAGGFALHPSASG